MSNAQVEKKVLEVLEENQGEMPARQLSASLHRQSVSDEQRRQALLNLASSNKVKVASGTVKVKR